MFLVELFVGESSVTIEENAKIAWARSGNKVIRKYRCTGGPRQGRIVNSPADCNKPFDIQKRVRLRQTKLAKGERMKRKRIRTMRRNPASIRIQKMNKAATAI